MRPRPPAGKLATSLEISGVAFLIAGLAIGVLFGGGASSASRQCMLFLASLGAAATIGSMAAMGAWRIVRNPLWLAPVFPLLLAVAQMTPLRAAAPGSSDLLPSPGSAYPSVSRQATLEWIFLGASLVLFSFIAALQLRTVRRLTWTVGSLCALLLATGFFGGMGRILNRSAYMGFLNVEVSPSALGELFVADSAFGPLSSLAWREAIPTVGGARWFEPVRVRAEFFGGFWDVGHWSACIAGLLPMLLAIGLLRARESDGADEFGLESSFAPVRAAMIALAAITGWFAPPHFAISAIVPGLAVFVLCCGKEYRRRAAVETLFVGGAGVGLAAIHAHLNGGAPTLLGSLRDSVTSDAIVLSSLRGVGLLGGGLGAFSDVWPAITHGQGSPSGLPGSLFSLILEIGLIGGAAAIVAALYGAARFTWIAPRMEASERLACAGAAAGLVAIASSSLLGPGVDSPVVLAIGVMLLACFSRGVAGDGAFANGAVEP